MEKNQIKILIVDDDEDDFLIISDLLSEISETHYEIKWLNNYPAAFECLNNHTQFDILLFDYRLGAYNGLELLQEVIRLGCKAPVILMTGQGDHEIDLEAMRLGAADYLIKNEVGSSLLERSIRYAIEHKKMEDELFQEKERAIVTLESIGDSVIILNPSGTINHLNPVAEKMLGWSNTEAQDLTLFGVVCFINEVSLETIENPMDLVLQKNRIANFPNQTLLINRDGREFAIEGSASPIHNRDHQIIGIIIVLHDVTDNRELSKKLSYQASHDSLTGLINRFKFEEKLQELIVKTTNQTFEHVLFYLDLDQFKIVNDTCGHFAGDQLLKQISSLMKQKIRHSDIVARLGGDEFGVLLENCPLPKACEIAENICQAIRNFRFIWKEKPFNIGVSIGVVAVNANSGDIDQIFSAADQSCYIAKEKGGNRYHIYYDHDQELTERHGEMKFISIITKAFEEKRFTLHFQSIVPVIKNTPCYWHEILIRMFDENGELIYPNTFLPAAQRYNMMTAIDRWVILNFFALYHDHFQHFPPTNSLIFNINISGASLNNDFFLNFIIDQLREYEIPPEVICFEITETIAIANFNSAIYFIQKLKSLGCQFALDDFGSGLSSFNYLKYLPVNYLKIDGSFIKNINEGSIDCTMVTAINEIAHLMGIETIAEFVESEAIFNKLKAIGVDYAQGYWISKPSPLEKTELLTKIS